jgi:hypothetical protein
MARTTGTKSGENETSSGYFRRILKENPKLLKKGTNAELFERWLQDHPGHAEVPDNVKAILHNLKSVLRKKRRQRRAEATEAATVSTGGMAAPTISVKASVVRLEALQDQIDDCLAVARTMDREGLAEVIQLLRRARNRVVHQVGA